MWCKMGTWREGECTTADMEGGRVQDGDDTAMKGPAVLATCNSPVPGWVTIFCSNSTGFPPDDVNIVCMGTALPVIPGMPNMLGLLCITEAETIWADDMLEIPAITLSLAAWSLIFPCISLAFFLARTCMWLETYSETCPMWHLMNKFSIIWPNICVL
jgi:hypothetical protein